MRRVTVAAACLALMALPVPGAAAELRVPWTFDISQQALEPNAPPPGSNDWSCKPTKRHPRPVILVHGLLANRTVNFPTLSPFLANRGFCVFALTYGTRPELNLGVYRPGGLVRMEGSALKLKRFVARVLKKTGARRVDIVGHSEGSLMPNYYVKFLGGRKQVAKYVGVTPLWNGTNLVGAADLAALGKPFGLDSVVFELLEPLCASCEQFIRGSEFLELINRGRTGPRVRGVKYTMIMTRNDELVVPYTSGFMRGAKNVVVQDVCALDQSEHLSIIFDPVTAYTILNALDPRHPQPVPCVPVLPGLGAVGYSGN